jgi:hypothetical protein
MRSATFLLSKHPYAQAAGDTRVSRLLIELAAESVTVRGLALWSGPTAAAPIPLKCLPKPPVRIGALAVRSLLAGRSLVHGRYLTDELVRAVRAERSEAVIAEHTYMAEAALAAGRAGHGLLINTHVLESSVLEARAATARRLAPLRIEAARTQRDEVRCSRAAGAVVCLGESDVAILRAAGVGARRLDLVLPPLERAPLEGPPLALFVGDRGWRPNADAARGLLDAWPGIVARAPGAQLVIAGIPARRERRPQLPGVRWLGFVDDLEPLYASARVVLAPVAIGGGVRVKILEAAARGIPVVATRQGLGSIGEYLPIAPVSGESELIERGARLLRDRDTARAVGEGLFEVNAELWRTRFVHRGVEAWLAAGAGATPPGPVGPPRGS